MDSRDHAPQAGRPRNAAASGAILEAARELVAQRGYRAVTTQDIAEAAGVGKQTLYRRWPSKAELVLDAFLEDAEAAVDRGVATSRGSLERRLRGFLERTFAALERSGPAVRSLMAHAQEDVAFRETFRKRFIAPRRAALSALIVGAAGHGERPARVATANIDAAVIAAYGAVWYRLLLDEPLDRGLAGSLATVLVLGLDRLREGR
jgi:AcrR family transcriptional regulator